MRTTTIVTKLAVVATLALSTACSVEDEASHENAVQVPKQEKVISAQDKQDLTYLAWRLDQDGGTCTQGLEAYSKTVYPLVRERCTKCHNDGSGEIADGPDFASANMTTSYLHVKNLVNFANMPKSKLVETGGNLHCLLQYGYPCNTDGQELLQNIQRWWEQGEKECPSAGNYFTLGTKLPENMPTQDQGFTTLRWPLKHIGGPLVGGVFEVEIQKFGESPTDQRPAYRFRRPRLALPAGGKVLVKDIKVLINGQYDQLANSYTKIENVVEGRKFDMNDRILPFPNLSNRNLILLGNNKATDQISVSFGDLSESRLVTQCKNMAQFNEQIGSFIKARNCVGCHAQNPEVNLASAFKRLALDVSKEDQCRLMKERIEVAYPYLSSIVDYVVRGNGVHAQVANSVDEFLPRWLDWFAVEGAFTTASFTDPAIIATQAMQQNFDSVAIEHTTRKYPEVREESDVVKQLALGQDHSCVLFATNQVKCWGQNESGQLGLGDTRNRGAAAADMGVNLPYLALTTDGSKVQKLALGSTHSCVLFDNGKMKCWGKNDYGQLGLPGLTQTGNTAETTPDKTPYIDLGSTQAVVDIDAGVSVTCAVLANGEAKCWGLNQIGQLGQGDRTNRGSAADTMGANLKPISLPSGRKATQVGIGNRHVCVVLDKKDIVCWGDGSYGVLGIGTQTPIGISADQMGSALKLVDLGVPADWRIKNLQVAFVHNCALYTNGATKCWGYNKDGRLGLGDANDRGSGVAPMGTALPALLVTPLNVAQDLSCHYRHCCETFVSHNSKCWGINSNGQLGSGGIKNRGLTPLDMGAELPFVDIGTLAEVKQVVAGGNMSCALFASNQVKCWGLNNNGQLGLGDNVQRSELTALGDKLPFVKLN